MKPTHTLCLIVIAAMVIAEGATFAQQAGSGGGAIQQQPPAQAPAQAKPAAAADAKPADAAAKPAQAPVNPTAGLQKAYTDAVRTKEPEARIAALQKVAEQAPAAMFSIALMARGSALETMCKTSPAQTDRIRAEIDAMLKVRATASVHLIVAKILLSQNVMLPVAEEMARKALTMFEEETAASAAADRAKFKSALGLVYLKNGKVAEGDALLKEVAVLDAMPPFDAPTGMGRMMDEALAGWNKGQRQAAVALARADAAEKQGDFKAAADALADASMLAPMKSVDRKRLEEFHRKTHGGTLDGLEDALDAKYRALNPLTFKVNAYTPAPNRTRRTVLAEMFTGSGCNPCVAADLGFDALLQRYSRQEMALLVYHLHIPAPDPMTNPAANARAKATGVNSTPSYFINGGDKQTGGGDRSGAKGFYDNLSATIDKLLLSAPEANIVLQALSAQDTVKVAVTVDPITNESPDLRLHIALVEHELSYTGQNGVRFHPMVVRQLAGENHAGFVVPPGKPLTVEHQFDVAAVSAEIQKYIDNFVENPPDALAGEDISFGKPMHAIRRDHLAVVAFVQDGKTKQVLQAAYVDVKPSSGSVARPKK